MTYKDELIDTQEGMVRILASGCEGILRAYRDGELAALKACRGFTADEMDAEYNNVKHDSLLLAASDEPDEFLLAYFQGIMAQLKYISGKLREIEDIIKIG